MNIEVFNFCLFVCTSRFANFARGKWPKHDFKNHKILNQYCDVVSNVVVEIPTYNFDLFHSVLDTYETVMTTRALVLLSTKQEKKI